MTFVLIVSIWANVMNYPHYYRFEMSRDDCRAMLSVIENYPKTKDPDVHAVCVPKE